MTTGPRLAYVSQTDASAKATDWIPNKFDLMICMTSFIRDEVGISTLSLTLNLKVIQQLLWHTTIVVSNGGSVTYTILIFGQRTLTKQSSRYIFSSLDTMSKIEYPNPL